MKIIMSFLLVAFSLLTFQTKVFAAAETQSTQPHSQQESQGYHCPMHPKIKGQQGDSCPKCGMNLTPIGQQTKPHAKHKMTHAKYHCPMHPKVKGQQGDSCPKCGMDLTPIGQQTKPHAKHKMTHAKYHCPMHPKVKGQQGDS
ncbi:heavy metal-binding domain-containing protein, partial [Shewanella gelidii]|uniref:heavy metal-binding domain-containing protein n=1 Tax=Shewanella gelidii TaxID=1642821 RepID=UPI00200F46BF